MTNPNVPTQDPTPAAPRWLDEVEGERALDWVRERNAATETELGGPHLAHLEARLREVLDSPDRIPFISVRGEWAFNFWTDGEHPRGLWRRQLLDAYLEGGEEWEVLLDVDALSAAEGRSWVWHGATVLYPDRDRALIGSVALGVALSLGTIGLSQTASSQVSDIFDSQRNTRVAMTSPTLEAGTPSATQAASADSLARLRALAGVNDAAVFLTHEPVNVTTTPSGSANSAQPDLVGAVGGSIPTGLLTVDTQGAPITELSEGEVLVGAQAASAMELGPLLASPVIWVDGNPRHVVGILTDAGLQASLLNSIIAPEATAAQLSDASYGTAEIRVVAGAAQQVATQAPAARIPADQGTIGINAPPDPTSLRDQIESNLNTMLLTLTGVALLTAVLSLTNSMTTAVFQRTGEFGLRRAIGARRLHITQLVLTESVVIGVIGGIVGSYVSVLGILTVTLARHWQPVLDLTTVPLGILGGTLVGLVGGLVAARRASRIQPSDALKAT